MVKRIPCRVVRTKPLGESSNALHHASRANHFNCKLADINPQYKSTNDTVIYTRMLELTKISKDKGLTGEILDCYI